MKRRICMVACVATRVSLPRNRITLRQAYGTFHNNKAETC
jgi:hypothetical protein